MKNKWLSVAIVCIVLLVIVFFVSCTSNPSQTPTSTQYNTLTSPSTSASAPIIEDEPESKTKPAIAPKPGTRNTLVEVDFSAIDEHALKAPESVANSIESLATYLTKPAKNDLEKARAIFIWITHNIAYDVDSYFSGSFGSFDPDDLLYRRSSVCYGYANLFEQLGKSAGLKVVTITGWGKGYSYTVGDPIEKKTNHAWNVVQIDDGWYFVECTWGTGAINENKIFIWEFEPHFFLTPPEQLIYTHLPEKEEWQLLETPITKDEFANLPKVKARFFSNGLKLDSHSESVIRAEHDINISLYAPEDVLITATLIQDEQKLRENSTFTQRKDVNTYEIKALFSDSGNYVLRIFSKRESIEGNYWSTLEYKIEVSEGLSNIDIGFPAQYRTFIEHDAYLYQPSTGYLKSGTVNNFKLRCPDAEEVALIQGESWIHLIKEGCVFHKEIKVREGEAELSAKFPGSNTYWTLVSYEVIKSN